MYDVELNGVVIKMRSIKRKIYFGAAWEKLYKMNNLFFTKREIDLSGEEQKKIDLDLLIINFRIASKYKIRFSIICAVTQTEFLVGRVLWILVRWDKTLRG